MKPHSLSLNNLSDLGAIAFRFTKLDSLFSVQAWQAETLDDFMLATGMMRAAARKGCTPIDPQNIGRLLSQLNHGGSGPATGCVVLAKNAGEPAGFALLRAKPGQHLELTWLHVKNPHANDGVAEALWDQVVRAQKAWGFRILYVGMHARLPNSAFATFSEH